MRVANDDGSHTPLRDGLLSDSNSNGVSGFYQSDAADRQAFIRKITLFFFSFAIHNESVGSEMLETISHKWPQN